MQGHGVESALLGDAGELDAHDFAVIPAQAKLDREWNPDGSAHLAKDAGNQRKIAQQAGAAVALHDFFGGAAEVEVDAIEAEVFDHAGGVSEHAGIAAEK